MFSFSMPHFPFSVFKLWKKCPGSFVPSIPVRLFCMSSSYLQKAQKWLGM